MYQPYRTGDTVNRTRTLGLPNTCVVKSVSATYPNMVLALGSVSPYCRVNHFGGQNDDPLAAWADNSWTGYSSTFPRYASEGLNLNMQLPSLGPYASVTFTWFYAFTTPDLSTAIDQTGWINIASPLDLATGTNVSYSAVMYTPSVPTSVDFYILYGTVTFYAGSGTSFTNVTGGGRLYTVYFDSTQFPNGDAYMVSGDWVEGEGALSDCACPSPLLLCLAAEMQFGLRRRNPLPAKSDFH